MLSFFGRVAKGRPACIVDVESASAAAAVVIHTDGAMRILASERVALQIAERSSAQTGTQLAAIVREATEKTLKKYAESDAPRGHGPIKDVHVIIGAPHARSRTEYAEHIFDSEKAITAAVIQGLAKEALQKPTDHGSRAVFETSVIRVQLNGYPTGKPLGKRATRVAVTVLESDIEPSIQKEIEAVLGALFPGRSIDVRSHMRALFAVMHELSDSRQNLLISVGSESTLCAALRKDEIAEHKDVAEGTGTIVRRLAGEKGLPEETLSLLRMLVDGTCAGDACDALKNGLAKIEPELTKTFGDAFSSLATLRRLPNSCILVAHADFAPWLEHFFSRLDFSPFTITMQPFNVATITPEHVSKFATWAPGVRADTGIAIATAFAYLEHV